MISTAVALTELTPPNVPVPGNAEDVPVRVIKSENLMQLGQNLSKLFEAYISDRRIVELRWLRNQRQYLGVYDPEVETQLSATRSRAYPRITRVKCVSVLARLMNLMFPGNERNWTLKAAPNADMTKDDVKEAVNKAIKKDQDQGIQPQIDLEYLKAACQELADERAQDLSDLIDDQLQELGGDQTYDYVALNRQVVRSGIIYGVGVLRGPYARKAKTVLWEIDEKTQAPKSSTITTYKPMFEFLKVWDFYPDLSAKTLADMDGYFTRRVMSRAQLKALAKRDDFFAEMIDKYLISKPMGNYRPQPFETELRAMGIKANVNEMKTETSKYEVISWHGKTSGQYLQLAGCEVPKDKVSEDIDAEVWFIDGIVIKADLNPWIELGVDVKTLHTFIFDEDDTSPLGSGLPNTMRDSQMAVSAASRMLMDNASVVCGPQLEVNTDLLRADQDLAATSAYKIWYREGTGPESQFPAVRNVEINSHMNELLKIIELFLKFADTETFVGPATGGDMAQTPSEPMRTAAGASMMRGDAALPFKDIVRSFDAFTQSVIMAMVQFNRQFNPRQAKESDYDVIARGADSLVAKEIRGAQIDQLAATLTDEEKAEVDMRKLARARLQVRDLGDLLLSEQDSDRAAQQRAQASQAADDAQQKLAEANVRKLLSDAFKNIAAGQKNTAQSDAASIKSAIEILERGLQHELTAIGGQQDVSGNQASTGTTGPVPAPAPGNPGDASGAGAGQQPSPGGGQ